MNYGLGDALGLSGLFAAGTALGAQDPRAMQNYYAVNRGSLAYANLQAVYGQSTPLLLGPRSYRGSKYYEGSPAEFGRNVKHR